MAKKLISILVLLCLLSTTAFADHDLLRKGDTYLESNDSEHAFLAYELAIADQPDDPSVLLHVAKAYQSIEDKEQALKRIEQALKLDPSFGDAYLLRMRLTMEDHPAEAHQDMLRAEILEVLPTPTDYADLAVALYRSGDAERAAKLFDLSGDIAKSDAYRDVFAYTLYATGNADKVNDILGGQSWADPQIKLIAESTSSLRLREINAFDPNKQYTLILPAHAVQSENYASMASWIESVGGSKQSDGSYHAAVTEDMMGIFAEDCKIFSISPDGSTTLFRDHSMWYALRNELVIPLIQTNNRGVADEYGNLQKALSSSTFACSPGSVSWSPDGRYFTLTSVKQSLIMGQFFADLFIFDAETGEAFVGATYPNKVRDEGCATVFQTVFDDTGRYIYYSLYGNKHEYRVSLMRYDMETNESTLCYNGPEFAAFPMLCFDHAGRLINMADSMNNDDMSGLNVYTQLLSGWTNDRIQSKVPFALGYPKWMEYSAISRNGLLLRTLNAIGINLVSCFTMLDTCEGLNRYLIIEDLDAEKAVLTDITEDSLQSMIERIPASEDSAVTYRAVGVCICNAQLSPDGNYALLLAAKDDDYRLLLLKLEDLSLRPVACALHLGETASFDTSLSAQYPQGINWVSGTKFIVNTKEGTKLMELCTGD